MNNNNFYIVLMAGGSGTRLWPMSREAMPKQFHKFTSEKSLLQETYERIKDLVPKDNIFISLNPKALKATHKQLKKIPKENYIVEPIAKNTGPSTALVTAKIFKKDPSAIIAMISSDHTVDKVSNYQNTFTKAFNFVKNNPAYLVTIGIEPTSPHTGYGYIKVGPKISNKVAYKVDKFVEKPSLKAAEKYFKSGNYLWNAGYFVFKAGEIIKMYEAYAPDIFAGLKNILRAVDTPKEEKVTKAEFDKFNKVPIDTCLAEKVDKIAVITADLGWSDVGSWASLYELLSQKTQNHIVSQGHHIGINDKNCLIYAQDKLLATVGLEDIIIVDTADVTLVCHKDKSQEIRDLLEKIKKEGKERYL